MEKGLEKENSRQINGRNIGISREHLVASIPLIRIVNRVGIHVPAVAIPIAVDRAKHAKALEQKTIYTTAHRMLSGPNFIRDIKVLQFSAPIP